MADKEFWLTSADLVDFLTKHRDNDVRVNINDINVPLITCHYDRAADMLILEPDTDSEDYKIAMSE